jgi:N-acetylmuramoyl-L-alanine amidase
MRIQQLIALNRQQSIVERNWSLKESETQEDEDFIVLQPLPETAPICTDVKQLRDHIRNHKWTRTPTHLFVHCTGTQPTATVSAIRAHWRRKGWKNDGYHVILPTEGFTLLVDFNNVSNGASGYNARGLHISYIGGVANGRSANTMTSSQNRLILAFIEEVKAIFPNIKILGHNEVNPSKACPSFDVKVQYPQHWTGV